MTYTCTVSKYTNYRLSVDNCHGFHNILQWMSPLKLYIVAQGNLGQWQNFHPLGPSPSHYWAIVSLPYSPVVPRGLQATRVRHWHTPLSPQDYVCNDPALQRPRRLAQLPSPHEANTGQSLSLSGSLCAMDLDQQTQHDIMDSVTMLDNFLVDMQLQSVDIPTSCVYWDQGFGILLHHFQPKVLLQQRINTYSFVAGDTSYFQWPMLLLSCCYKWANRNFPSDWQDFSHSNF